MRRAESLAKMLNFIIGEVVRHHKVIAGKALTSDGASDA